MSSTARTACAQEMVDSPAMEADMMEDMPTTEMGGGDFFSQDLGTLLRMRYNTRSYGQDRRGNLDIGTMRVASFEDAIAFFDGQATLSDVNGVGYNLGVGFRWLHWVPFPLEPERITGFSFWADGTSTEAGNFFPQIGLSYESLGDMWDFRVNGYIPIGQESQLGTFNETGAVAFSENFLVMESIADRNTSFNVAEAEVARRLMPDRDAWAFVGPYVLTNSDQDAAGYRAGFRGYAYPDLMLQIAVTDDDIFKTNAAFSITWFVGRTRTNFQPACGLPDRMREPVMRNDYVALQRTQEVGGEALTNTAGDTFRFVHVNSESPNGGDGTFENPLNDVGTVEPNSQEDDIVLLYSNSNFNSQATLALQDNQRLLGEGLGEFFTINTQQSGVVVIPETSPGARDGARANIIGSTGPTGAVRLADTNEVANFNIDGTGTAANIAGIFSPGTGAGNPNIHDMDFANVTGTGIQFTPLTREDDDNPLLMTVAGNVTIDDIEFDNMLGVEIDINSFTNTPTNDPNVTLQETIAISNIDSQNGSSTGIWLRNTHASRTATITNYTNGTAGSAGSGGGLSANGVLAFEGDAANDFDGNVTLTNIDIFQNTGYALHFANQSSSSTTTLTTGNGLTWDGAGELAGGMRFNTFNGTFNGASSTLTNGTLSAVRVGGVSDGTINLASTVTFSSNDPGANEAVINVGQELTDNFTGALTVSGGITNHNTGRLVSIQRVSGAGTTVTLGGAMTDDPNTNSEGIYVGNNTDGTILFSGNLNINTTGAHGIQLQNNNAATDISFAGQLEIVTDGADATAFLAEGGGMLTVGANNNELTSDGSSVLVIDGMEINTTGGANFSKVTGTGGVNGIRLATNTGGPITIGILGDDPGETGTISGTSGAAVVVTNSANVTINSLQVDTTAGQTGVQVTKTTTGTQLTNLNDLEINGGANGIDVIGDGGATDTLNMTVNDTAINNATARGIRINNVDAGTIAVNGTTIDGDNTTAGAEGVEIIGSNATITFDATTTIAEFDGTDFHVNGGTAGSITYSGDITNTEGRSVVVENRTGGSVQFASGGDITDSGQGILVQNNGNNAAISFLGTNTLTTGANDAVTVTNNDNGGTNATVTFASLDITNTGAGRGLVATAGGTLAVTGTTNQIDTVQGSGLVLTDMNITSVDFQHVNVTGAGGAPVNAILLTNLTGGQVEIGTSTGADGSGGSLSSTGAAIAITNAANVALHDIDVVNASGGDAVSITKSSAAASIVTLDNVDATNAGQNGVGITASSSGTLNVTMTDTDMTTVGNHGIAVTQSGTGAVTVTATDTDLATVTQDGVNMNVTGSGAVNFTATTTALGTVGGQAVELDANTSANTVNLTFSGLTTSDAIDIDAQDNANVDFRISGSTITGANVTATTIDSAALDYRFTNSTITGSTTMNINGSGDFDMLVENSSITTTGATNGLVLTLGSNSQDADIIIRNNATFDAATGQALVVTANGTNADIDFLLSGNDMSDSGGLATVDIRISGGALFDANVVNNTLADSGGDELYMQSDGSSTRINLDLDNNNAGVLGVYHLDTDNNGGGFNFGVVDRDNADDNNIGTINFDPLIADFEDITGPVPQPVLP